MRYRNDTIVWLVYGVPGPPLQYARPAIIIHSSKINPLQEIGSHPESERHPQTSVFPHRVTIYGGAHIHGAPLFLYRSSSSRAPQPRSDTARSALDDVHHRLEQSTALTHDDRGESNAHWVEAQADAWCSAEDTATRVPPITRLRLSRIDTEKDIP